MEIDLISINVRGIRNPWKWQTVFDYLKSLKGTVYFLQEVHLRDKGDCVRFGREWGGGGAEWTVGGMHSTGVGILFGDPGVQIEEVFVVMQGRVIGVDFCLRGVEFSVLCLWAPRGGGEMPVLEQWQG